MSLGQFDESRTLRFLSFLVSLEALRNDMHFLTFPHIKKDSDRVFYNSPPSIEWGSLPKLQS